VSGRRMGRVLDRYDIDAQIVRCIALKPEATIEFISQQTKLSYTAIRNGVHRLASLGAIEEYEPTGKRGRGRPAARFRLDRGLRILIPPRQFQHLAGTIIEQLVREEGTPRVERLLENAARAHATELYVSWQKEGAVPTSLASVLERIRDILNLQGCYAVTRIEGPVHCLEVHNCVYVDLAVNYPGTICHYHSTFIGHLAGLAIPRAKHTHESKISQGDQVCRFFITIPQPAADSGV
jgi:predicted ArsR family transcriptional regulator